MRKPVLSLIRPLFFLLLLSFYMLNTDSTPLLALHAVSAAFFLTSSVVLAGWIPGPRLWHIALLYLEILWGTALLFLVSTYQPNGPMPALFSPIFVGLFFELERRWLKPTLAATTALWLLAYLPEAGQRAPAMALFSIGLYGAFHLFSAAMGSLMRDLREEKERSEELLTRVQGSQAALERAHRQLTESAARQQEMAVLEERQRLAREIHDSVAHSLTALVVQLQAARRLADLAPEQSAATLLQCEETARHALLETRQAVRALHPGGLSQSTELEALARLGRDFGAATGMTVSVDADEGARALPPDPNRLEQLYRIFQEALTNAHRHGGARQVAGHLSGRGEWLELIVTNDGSPPASLEPGVGMRSMAERARSLGGSIGYEPGDAGLTIRVTVPVRREAVS
ncbi:MAG: sensor histidine kinase [Bacillota bacterium]